MLRRSLCLFARTHSCGGVASSSPAVTIIAGAGVSSRILLSAATPLLHATGSAQSAFSGKFSTFVSSRAPSKSRGGGGSSSTTASHAGGGEVDSNPDPDHVLDAPRPKRARNAYNFFSAFMFKELKGQHPEWESHKLLQETAERWRGLSEEDKVSLGVLTMRNIEHHYSREYEWPAKLPAGGRVATLRRGVGTG